MYIQAYDEWGEGTTLAPTTYDGCRFLAQLKDSLHAKGWIADGSPYVMPPRPFLAGRYTLQAGSNGYISAYGEPPFVLGLTDHVGPPEMFEFVPIGDGVYAIRTKGERSSWVTAHGESPSRFRRTDRLESGGEFIVEPHPDGRISVRTRAGKYVSANHGGDRKLGQADRASGDGEKFIACRIDDWARPRESVGYPTHRRPRYGRR
jgi:hypothetical protein